MFIKDLLKIINAKPLSIIKMNKQINNFKLDSRLIEKNDAFICIGKGINYIDEAIRKGASLIICTEEIKVKRKICVLKVDNIHDTLLKIGTYLRNKYSYIPLVAITGSVGKTTTKELISNILQTKYNVLKNEGNKNNYLGIVSTLFKLNTNIDIIVMELGMNHFHELDELSIMLKPDISIITNIGTSHIGNLGSKKNILKAKQEILEGMNNGPLIIPSNDKYLSKIKYNNIHNCKDIKISNIILNDSLLFNINYQNKTYNINFSIPNKSYIFNIILAFKCSTLFNIEHTNVINSINNYKSLDKRMNIIKINNNTLIDDTYNSSYESVKGSLDYLKNIKKPKLIILGDIKELGSYSKKIHKKINKLLNKIHNKQVLLVGNEVEVIKGIHFKDNNSLINYLDSVDITNKVIYLKASRMMKLEEIKDYFLTKRK